MCLLKSRGMSAVCTWGLRGAFFRLVFFCDLPPCCFVGHFPLRVPTLILRFFWNDRIASPTICLCHPSTDMMATTMATCNNNNDNGDGTTARWRRRDGDGVTMMVTTQRATMTMMMVTARQDATTRTMATDGARRLSLTVRD